MDTGINCIDGGFVLEYLSKSGDSPAKDVQEARRILRRRFALEMNKYNIRYGHGIGLEGERIENERFVGGNIYLDEPYAYFPPESVPADELKTMIQNKDIEKICEYYQKHLDAYLDFERKNGRSEKKFPSFSTATNL